MTISRRRFAGSLAGAAVTSLAGPNLASSQNARPIRIGLLAAKTGPLASGGIDMELALTMFLKERDNTLAGRKMELIVADTAGVPATARTKAQELIEKTTFIASLARSPPSRRLRLPTTSLKKKYLRWVSRRRKT